MTIPHVSVVMAVYNCGPWLDESIRSVVAQSFADWELVIVDDGSTDDTAAILRAWEARDPRVRPFHQQNSGRPAFGRNHGLRESRGEIITFLDGDDLYHPDKLARQIAVFDAFPEVGGVFHDYRWFGPGASPDAGVRYLEGEQFLTRAGRCFTRRQVGAGEVFIGNDDLIRFMSVEIIGIHTSAIAVRRSVLSSLDQPPFDEQLPHGEDVHLWLRIARATRLACLDQVLSYYRYRSTSWVSTLDRRSLDQGSYLVKREMLERLQESLPAAEWPQYREKVAEYWYEMGYRSLVGGLIREARRSFRSSLRRTRNPRRVFRNLKGLAVSVLPRAVTRYWWRLTGGGEYAPRRAP